jgi:putative hydrolase of the HAD superfamily
MAMRTVHAISLDVGGTLIDPHPSVGHVYAAVAAEHGLHRDPAALNRHFARAWKEKTGFVYSRSCWQRLVCRTFELEPVPFFDALYQRFTRPQAWRLHPDVLPALRTLRAAGFKLGVLSNWDERLRPLLSLLGLGQFLHTVVVSCETAWQKPAPEIFHLAAERMGVPPGQLLHVGDSWREDLEGARAAGAHALWLRRGPGPGEEAGSGGEALRIASLEAVAGWIRRLNKNG